MMTASQDWWPADYGHYGPLFIRMTWHAAGTYRIADGRGGGGEGAQRFAPLNSWPDNASLDKARRLLWPVKQKYGRKISWADLIVFAGNCAIESMGLKTFGFGFGRPDIWEPDEIFWGPEDTWLGDERYSGERELANPLGAVQMGLIYVNPEGPNGNPDPLAAAKDIRETFARMAMDDEETVALIIGGHTFGKCHGAVGAEYVGPEPEGCPVEAQGLGWHNTFGSGKGADTLTSGLEGAWTNNPIAVGQRVPRQPLQVRLGADDEPRRRAAVDAQGRRRPRATVPDAHDPSKRHAPMMLTTDLALKVDPIYGPISKRFHENPDQLADAFARAWYKLLHRDMGPSRATSARGSRSRSCGRTPSRPSTTTWSASGTSPPSRARSSRRACPSPSWSRPRGRRRRASAAPTSGAAPTAPGSAWRRRRTGTPTTRPSWPRCCRPSRGSSRTSTARSRAGRRSRWPTSSSWAVARPSSRRRRTPGHDITVPFAPGRTDASQEQTDVDSFAVLEPAADGFRNYFRLGRQAAAGDAAGRPGQPADADRSRDDGAHRRHAGAGRQRRADHARHLHRPARDADERLLRATCSTWARSGRRRPRRRTCTRVAIASPAQVKWTATAVDLVFGSNSELRALAEVYACDDAKEKFVRDFVAAWDKVMNLDRFDLA